jgi:hypothetical protein
MRDYQKPFIEDEEINIEDICTTSFEQPKDSFSDDDDEIMI